MKGRTAMHLLIESTTPQNPTVKIQWCLDPVDRAELLERHADNIHILVVTRYQNGAEDRQLRPLREAETYVSLRFPGKHTVHARLVWPFGNSDKDLTRFRKILNRKNARTYEEEVLSHNGAEFLDSFSRGLHAQRLIAEPVDIEVSSEYFAPEPPEWLDRWVNLGYEYKPVDQCQFRKRALFAFSLQLPLTLLWWVVLSLVNSATLVCGLLLGARGLRVDQVFKFGLPNDVWPKVDIGGYQGRSLWCVEDGNGKKRYRRIVFMPGLLLLLGLASWVLCRFGWMSFTWLASTLAAAILLGLAGLWIYDKVQDRMDRDRWEREREQREQRRREEALAEEKRKARINQMYLLLACPTAPTEDGLRRIPLARRTVRLVFLGVKRAVCRPFAG